MIFNVFNEEELLFYINENNILLIHGFIKLTTKLKLNKITLVGIGNAGFLLNNSKEITLNNRCNLSNIKIYNSNNNGIKIIGSKNILNKVDVSNCKNTGIQITTSASKNKIYNCISYDNYSSTNKADGFGCKFDSGKGNVFKNCLAENNEDDGFDLFEAKYGVKLIDCRAVRNGTGKNSTGSGFKLGGFNSNSRLYKTAKHKLINCISINNKNYGFTANNQISKIVLKKCYAANNGKENYFFPKISHPKLIEELKLGKFYLYNCKSENGNNNILGVINGCRL